LLINLRITASWYLRQNSPTASTECQASLGFTWQTGGAIAATAFCLASAPATRLMRKSKRVWGRKKRTTGGGTTSTTKKTGRKTGCVSESGAGSHTWRVNLRVSTRT